MTEPRSLLILGAGRHQVPLIREAARRGFFTVIADNVEGSPGRRFCSVETMVSALDYEGCRALALQYKVSGILTAGTDQPVLIMARLSAELGLPCWISPEGALLATHKRLQREAMALAGVPQPRFMACNAPAELAGWTGFPAVVKPVDSQGQRGVTRVMDALSLEVAVQAAREQSRSAGVIIEEFIDGQEVTANVWLSGGRPGFMAIADRVTYSKGCMGVCFQHVFPSKAAEGHEVAIERMVSDIASVLGMQEGPLYVQMIMSARGPLLVEAAARLGGGHEMLLLPSMGALDPVAQLFDAIEGRCFEGASRLSPAVAGVVNFLFAHAGTVAGVSALPVEGMREGEFYVKPGSITSGMRDGQGRIGYFLVTAATREEALAKAVTIYESLSAMNTDGHAMMFRPSDNTLLSPYASA